MRLFDTALTVAEKVQPLYVENDWQLVNWETGKNEIPSVERIALLVESLLATAMEDQSQDTRFVSSGRIQVSRTAESAYLAPRYSISLILYSGDLNEGS